jgi:hypothetical protein
LENIRDYLAFSLGVNGSHLAYVVRNDVVVPDTAEDPVDGYLMVEQEIIHRASHSGPAFRNDRRIFWDVMSNICGQHAYWIYSKPSQKANDGRRPMSCCLTIILDHIMWVKWQALPRPSWPAPCKMVRRKGSLLKPMFGFTLSNMQSCMV